MDLTARFQTLVQGPEPAIPLDELTLLVGAHAEPGVDVASWLEALDHLAARCVDASFAGDAFRYGGNRGDYYDPRNSYLHHVIERRVGIPITLSILTIELGRRLGVPMVGVGMPGHFLVRDGLDADTFADPFDGRLLDRDGCERAFAETQPEMTFDVSFLAPIGTRAIVTRLLANLKGIYLARRDRRALAWVLGLHGCAPRTCSAGFSRGPTAGRPCPACPSRNAGSSRQRSRPMAASSTPPRCWISWSRRRRRPATRRWPKRPIAARPVCELA